MLRLVIILLCITNVISLFGLIYYLRWNDKHLKFEAELMKEVIQVEKEWDELIKENLRMQEFVDWIEYRKYYKD